MLRERAPANRLLQRPTLLRGMRKPQRVPGRPLHLPQHQLRLLQSPHGAIAQPPVGPILLINSAVPATENHRLMLQRRQPQLMGAPSVGERTMPRPNAAPRVALVRLVQPVRRLAEGTGRPRLAAIVEDVKPVTEVLRLARTVASEDTKLRSAVAKAKAADGVLVGAVAGAAGADRVVAASRPIKTANPRTQSRPMRLWELQKLPHRRPPPRKHGPVAASPRLVLTAINGICRTCHETVFCSVHTPEPNRTNFQPLPVLNPHAMIPTWF